MGNIVPAHPIRQRLIPARILNYLLYAHPEAVDWLDSVSEDTVRVYTGPASRSFRMKISDLRDAIYWLKDQELVVNVAPERKRGTLLIKLRQPTNIKH